MVKAAMLGATYLGDFAQGDDIFGSVSFHDDEMICQNPDISGASLTAFRRSDLTSIGLTASISNIGGGGTSGVLWTFDTSQDGTFFGPGADDFAIYLNSVVLGLNTINSIMVGQFSILGRNVLRPSVAGRQLVIDTGGRALADLDKISGAAISTNAAQLGVNIVNVEGVAVEAGSGFLDVNIKRLDGSAIQSSGGYMKVSAGTGTGQLNLASGRIGVNWADVASPTTAVGLSGTTIAASTATDALAAAIKVRTDLIPATPAFGVQKGGTFGPWPIIMRQVIDPTMPAPGLTVTAEVSLDGGAFAACVNAPVAVGSGVYKHTLAAADTNANKSICVKYTAAGGITEFLTLLPTP